MSNRIRLQLDEQVKSVIARELRHRGIDVTTTVEAGLRAKSDDAQVEFACQSKRVLFTQNEDFLKIVSLTGNHFGIAYRRQGTRSSSSSPLLFQQPLQPLQCPRHLFQSGLEQQQDR
ncbi:DUF5615 family PIN-like protein [Synechococcus sp. PCC 7336]|uniref:DUF5615 family PIN-like protein n=1 Tax=Synechococcus sp. PCC 7336 TaxID=195250 RepID=UPI0008FC14FF